MVITVDHEVIDSTAHGAPPLVVYDDDWKADYDLPSLELSNPLRHRADA